MQHLSGSDRDPDDRVQAAKNRVLIQRRIIASMFSCDPSLPMAMLLLEEMQKNLTLVETDRTLTRFCLEQPVEETSRSA